MISPASAKRATAFGPTEAKPGFVSEMKATLSLRTVIEDFELTLEEAGRLLAVSDRAVGLWLASGVPTDRMASVQRVASLSEILSQTFVKERLPEIVRSPMPGLRGHSILDTIGESGVGPVLAMLGSARSYVPPAT